jgi:hypothetical protein
MGTMARSDLREAIANSAEVLRIAVLPLAALKKTPGAASAGRRHVRKHRFRGPVSGKDLSY